MPDARSHAFPQCGSGPVRKTGNAQAGSATGYQSRNLFIEGGRQIAAKKKGRPVGLPLRTSSVLDACGIGSPHAVFWTVCSSGACVSPVGGGGRGWPDWASRRGLFVRAVILVIRIGRRRRQRIAKIAEINITCAIFNPG